MSSSFCPQTLQGCHFSQVTCEKNDLTTFHKLVVSFHRSFQRPDDGTNFAPWLDTLTLLRVAVRYERNKGHRYERSKDATKVAPGLTTRNKKLLVTRASLVIQVVRVL